MSTECLTILFGIGVLQVLLTAPGGIVEQIPKDLANLGRKHRPASFSAARPRSTGGAAMIEVDELTVRFGGVIPIDGMTVTFAGGTCGLIGPNGAGKTTFFNVLSGFVKPVARRRSRAFGDDLLAMPDFRRARWGAAAHVPDRAGHRQPDACSTTCSSCTSTRAAPARRGART